MRDQLVKSTYADGSSFVIAYWPTGLEAQRVDSVTGSKDKTYNVLGRLLTETGPVASTITYTYDPVGNITSYQDGAGKVTYGYDAANQLTQSIEPGGSCATGIESAADSGCIKYQYDANSAETTRTFPGNATVTTTRDNSGRPTRITGKNNAGTTVADVGYSFTAAGSTGPSADRTLIQTRTSYLEPNVPAGAITSYGYDSLKRLTAAVEKNGAAATASWSYAYDNAGNRTQQVRAGNTGATAGTIGYTYNAANWLTATTTDTITWTYDANGAQIRNGITGQTATVNNRGAVTGIGTTSYTGFGQGNTEQLTRSNSTSYTTSTLGLAREDLGGGAQRNYTRTGTGNAVSTRFGAGSKYHYIQDILGSVIGLFDKTGAYIGGYSYSPYGEQRATITAGSAIDSNSLRYISGYYDQGSGLYKLGARYYDPTIGRFTQFDPSGQEPNAYAYAGCNPINNSDATGLSCSQAILDATLASIGFAVALTAILGLGAIAGLINPLGAVAIATIIDSIGIGAIVGLAVSIIGGGEAVGAIQRECN